MSLLSRVRSLQQVQLHVLRRRIHWQVVNNSVCSFSSSTTNNTSIDRKTTRLGRTLYRKLLQWCHNTNPEMPLRHFIEPFSISPPQNLDQDKFQAILDYHDLDVSMVSPLIAAVYPMLPPHTSIYKEHIACQIHTVAHLKSLIRAMFRLNSQSTLTSTVGTEQQLNDVQKARIAYAFQTLRTLNELSEALADLNMHRLNHSERGDDISYFVGQVVQHKRERWRGVIAGWEKPADADSDSTSKPIQLSSLTTKIYTAQEFLKAVRYEVILDLADMHTLKSTAPVVVCTQQDLEPVQDDRLCRIRSTLVSQSFKGFDPISNTFVANNLLAYEYPVDREKQQAFGNNSNNNISNSKENAKDLLLASEAAAKETIQKIRSLMAHLEHMIHLPKDNEKRESLSLLRTIRQKLATQPPVGQNLVIQEDATPSVQKASAQLRYIYDFIMDLRDVLWHRKTFKELTVPPKFQLGQVVYHQFFGFRGVVVACDHVPKYNVRYWDGVRHIDDVLQKPFYHVLPDQEDCRTAFGGPRGMRYVCQDNLVECRSDRTDISVALDSLDDPAWSREMDSVGKTWFKPSSHALVSIGVVSDTHELD
jgi:hemimethylated DNA binding protein